jgi:plasmid maintenance system antidote protein VapI
MGDFTAVVRRYMQARGLSLRETARAAGYSDHTVLSKVLNGRRPVTPYLAACLDQALGANGEIAAAAQSAQAVADAARLPLRELADHAAELGAWAETGTAGPGTIAALDDEVIRLTREYGSSPPGPLIIRASDACRHASRLMRQHQRLRIARDLYVVAARACAFLSAALGDLAQQAEAAMYARTALILAEESGNPGAVATALSALSKVAFWDKQRGRAADLAAQGYAAARKGDPVRVLLACQQADASPVPAAREALALAAAALEDTDGTGDGGLFSAGRVRTAAYASTLALREGNPAGVLAAVADAEQAVADGESIPHGSWAQVQIMAALALLAAGDAEQAAGRLAPVLGLPPEMRLATFAGRLSVAGTLASTPAYADSGAARGIVEQVGDYLGRSSGDVMPYPLAIGPGATR